MNDFYEISHQIWKKLYILTQKKNNKLRLQTYNL